MYLDKEKIKETENSKFTKEQLDKYIRHCCLVDETSNVT